MEPSETMTKHPNHGTSLEDVLKEDRNLEIATTVAMKRVTAWQQENGKESPDTAHENTRKG